ncbi:ankyrin repeat-containing domain protein [Tricharina praecox]|uniref:ankyrin repeat-containing domain protein n=1 Tax=Tricharina praecox TaxID=43433 RepID=UPI0022204321|nr:ankyrin repeat-containing domain protein [Tricharina praecox]KAI5855420.1 ankyrin repeat-containing domain protein [Tricharina praecox]
MPSLATIPTEITLLITSFLPPNGGLGSLVRTNRHHYNTLNTVLYKRAAAELEPQHILEWALTNESETVLDVLLAQGLDLDDPLIRDDGFAKHWYPWSFELPTPLLAAVAGGNDWAVLTLIKKGVNVNTSKEFNETPLHHAARWGYTSLIRPLVEAGADIEARTLSSWCTPLWVASHCAGWEDPRRKRNTLEAIRELVALGADIEAKDFKSDLTCLMEAIESGYVKAVPVLLGCGASTKVKGKRGRNEPQPLHFALRKGWLATIRDLVEHGADIEATIGCIPNIYVGSPLEYFHYERQEYIDTLARTGRQIGDISPPMKDAFTDEGVEEVVRLLTPKTGREHTELVVG